MRRGFTLIELLVVISVIGVLISITLPALGSARETSRRTKCLANVRSIGNGFGMYLNDSKGKFPLVRPLHSGGGGGGGRPDPSLLDLLGDYLDAPVPRKDERGFFIVSDPYKCPSDIASADSAQEFEPVWRTDGTSYEYFPGAFMLLAEVLFMRDPALAVTKAYDADRRWPILMDQADWHKLRRSGPPRNAVYYPDYRADWAPELSQNDINRFIADMRRGG
ncbi:MAG: type II secretion system protein [Phycisphaerae bacterium]|nr:type II secretion system protein [Phycisphaerae bacterium]